MYEDRTKYFDSSPSKSSLLTSNATLLLLQCLVSVNKNINKQKKTLVYRKHLLQPAP